VIIVARSDKTRHDGFRKWRWEYLEKWFRCDGLSCEKCNYATECDEVWAMLGYLFRLEIYPVERR
jgi:hypothetical protein